MDIKYFKIGISLVTIEVLSIGILLIFNKKYTLLYFSLSSIILSLIGLLLFIFLWIGELIPSIYMSIFWLVTNAIFILKILAIQKICINFELYYSVSIFNYGIFLGSAYSIIEGIKFTYNKAKVKYNLLDNDSLFKTYIILLGQYATILLFAGIGFASGFGEIVKGDGNSLFLSIFIPANYILLLVISVTFGYFYFKKKSTEGDVWYSCHIAYIFNITAICYHFSSLLEIGIIMGTVTSVFLILAVNVISILITNKDTPIRILISSVIMSILSILSNYLILQNQTTLILNIILFGITTADLTIITNILKKKQERGECDNKYSVLCFNYLLFSLVAIIMLIILLFFCCILDLMSSN